MKTQLTILTLLAAGTVMAQQNREQEGGRRRAPDAGFMMRFDQDGDGQISADEFPGKEKLFVRLDVNGDGFISEDEAPTGPPPHKRHDKRGNREGEGDREERCDHDGQCAGKKERPSGERGFMHRFDENRDGQVSFDEFPGKERLFSKLDANGDGYISDDEAPKGRPPHKRGGPRDSDPEERE